MTPEQEKDKERKGFIVAAVVHALFILLFFFVTVWEQPDPPTPGMPGIDLNFGFDAAGSGDNNTMDPATEESTDNTETAENTEATDASSPSDPVTATTSDMASDHVVPDTKTTTTTTTSTKPNTSQSTSQQTKPQTTTAQSGKQSGDGDSDQKGNQGKTTGTIDGKGLYDGKGDGGNGPGGNGNSALSMDGWHLEAEPKILNNDKETGKVVFSIKVDKEGEIVGITVLQKQVSEALINKCKDEIYKMSFLPNKNNGNIPAFSTGTITFVFRVN